MTEANREAATEASAARGGAWFNAREILLLLILAAVQFTHIVDFMIIMPLGPVFRHEMRLSPSQFGAVVSAYSISAGLAGLLAAHYLDRFSRRNALLGLYTGFTVGTLSCALAPDFYFLLAARTGAGAFGGVVAALVLAIVGDTFAAARRGTAMGVVMSAFSVASIAGVPLGLLLAEEYSWQSTFIVLGGFSTAVLLLAAFTLPPLRGHLGRNPASVRDTWAVLIHPNHLRAFALTCALIFGSFLLAPHMATFLEANVGVQQTELKLIYLFGGLATLVTMTLFGRLADRFGKLRVFRILVLFTLAPILLLTNLPTGLSLPLVLTVTTLFMVTTSGRMVPVMALIAGSSAPAYRGSFMSFNAAVQQMAAGIATMLAGLMLYENEDGSLTGYSLVGLAACLSALASLVLAGRLRKDPGDRAPDAAALAEARPSPQEREPADSVQDLVP